MVDGSTLSSLQWNQIVLDPYPANHLFDIISSRSEEAFNDGALDDSCMQLAANIAGVYGDARYLLDLVHGAGKLADMSESSRILPEHIRSAKSQLPPEFRKEELSYLTKHQRLILMAVSNLLKKGDSTQVSIGEVEKSYAALCEDMGTDANHHTQVWNDVNELSRKGLIDAQLSGRGTRGRTTMIGLSRVSAKDLVGELERRMTADARG
jgi:cell division control protein 6